MIELLIVMGIVIAFTTLVDLSPLVMSKSTEDLLYAPDDAEDFNTITGYSASSPKEDTVAESESANPFGNRVTEGVSDDDLCDTDAQDKAMELLEEIYLGK